MSTKTEVNARIKVIQKSVNELETGHISDDDFFDSVLTQLEECPDAFTPETMMLLAEKTPSFYVALLSPGLTEYADFMYEDGQNSPGFPLLERLTPQILMKIGEYKYGTFDVGELTRVLTGMGMNDVWVERTFNVQVVAEIFRNYTGNMLWRNLSPELSEAVSQYYRKEITKTPEEIVEGLKAYIHEVKAANLFENIQTTAEYLTALRAFEELRKKSQVFFKAANLLKELKEEAEDEGKTKGKPFTLYNKLNDLGVESIYKEIEELRKPINPEGKGETHFWLSVAKREFPKHQKIIDDWMSDEDTGPSSYDNSTLWTKLLKQEIAEQAITAKSKQ